MPNKKNLEFKFERIIPAPAKEVFNSWFDPKVQGTVWNAAEEFSLDRQEGGLFYWQLRGISHYGRFIEIKRDKSIQHTWMSPNTLGQESLVTVSFKKIGRETLMTLTHSGLPDHKLARGHKDGWNYFLGIFTEQFGKGSRKKYRWEEAHPTGK
ncbi:MAG: SRPBCC family protein, partial [Pseudobdellovibrio sp.]